MASHSALSIDRMMDDLRTLARWVRESGSAEELEAARWVEGQLREMGCAVEIVRHDAYISLPRKAAVTVIAPARREVACVAVGMSAPTPPGGITGELVYAPDTSRASLAPAAAAGTIALIGAKATPQTATDVDLAGVRAAIFTSGHVIGEMTCSQVWGSPGERDVALLPKAHMWSVAKSDGEALRALCASGPVQVQAHADLDTGWTRTPIVIGDLPAGHPEAEPGKYVLFSGHIDSWHRGAMDNGSGNVVMLELMRWFAPRRAELRRGLRLAFWSGHSHGRYSGSAWYADHHWFDLEQHCVAHVNVDVPGAVGADLVVSTASPELHALAAWALKTAGGSTQPVGRPHRTSDESFWGIGVPTLFGEVSRHPDRTFGWWIHTVDDTVDKIDPPKLLRDAEIYRIAIDRLLTGPVLPFDYAATAADIRSNLETLARESGGRFDLRPAIDAASRLETLCGRMNGLRAPAERDPAARAALNQCAHDLGRLLIPPTYTTSGRFRQDPALASRFLPGLADAARLGALDPASGAAKFLLVDLVRARNELVHALEGAAHRVERLLDAAERRR